MVSMARLRNLPRPISGGRGRDDASSSIDLGDDLRADERRGADRSTLRVVSTDASKTVATLSERGRSQMLGIKRLRNELLRLDGLRLSLYSIHKDLRRHGLNRLKRPRGRVANPVEILWRYAPGV